MGTAIDFKVFASDDWLNIVFTHVNFIGYFLEEAPSLSSFISPAVAVCTIVELGSEENCQNMTPVFHWLC